MNIADLSEWRKTAGAVLSWASPPVVGAARRLADFLVPPACVACRSPLASHNCLCPTCWLQVDFIRPPLCDRLGIPLPYGLETPIVSARAAADPPVYNRARAIASHGGLMRDLAHRLKYGDQQHVVPLLARLLQDAGQELLPGCQLLIPIPLARRRLWRRGFNQAAVLAHALSRRSGVPHDPMLLDRKRETPSQVGLTREQRKDNMRGAFAIAEGRGIEVTGKNVLLLDDVITTGATLEAAARVLRRAGAVRIDALALTLVTDDGSAWRAD
jgi:ComF family protein